MRLTEDFELSARNTLGLASHARYGGVITDIRDIAPGIAAARDKGLAFHLLGGGSNCVLGERIEAVVGVMALRGRALDTGAPDVVRVTARAGEDWSDLVAWTVGQGIGGLENLVGIPGTVGAAPVQNIGAYGVEFRDVCETLTTVDTTTGAFRRFAGGECRFAYRHSRFKDEPGRYAVTEVTLALPRPWVPRLVYPGLTELPPTSDPQTVMERVLALRNAKLPDWRVTGNAGSFFHNPIVARSLEQRYRDVPHHIVDEGIKLSAGWLIEACGLKGHRIGDAGFSDRHALVLVNHGQATFSDVTRLAALAVERVRERFAVTLVQEPIVVA